MDLVFKNSTIMRKRINIWSSPRNISTAFMYSFAQRTDMTVVDEPLYAHFLSKTDSEAAHPGTSEILDKMESEGSKVVDHMLYGQYAKDSVLFKQMTHHLIQLEEDFLTKMDNVLLIRDPKRIIASYAKVIPNPELPDIGIKMQYDLFQKLSKAGKLAAVVDAKYLLLNPRGVLGQLCTHLDIPFQEQMLQWKAGPRPEDGCWAKYWYANVHQSTGFMPYEEKEIKLFGNLAELADRCQPYYSFLSEYTIK